MLNSSSWGEQVNDWPVVAALLSIRNHLSHLPLWNSCTCRREWGPVVSQQHLPIRVSKCNGDDVEKLHRQVRYIRYTWDLGLVLRLRGCRSISELIWGCVLWSAPYLLEQHLLYSSHSENAIWSREHETHQHPELLGKGASRHWRTRPCAQGDKRGVRERVNEATARSEVYLRERESDRMDTAQWGENFCLVILVF